MRVRVKPQPTEVELAEFLGLFTKNKKPDRLSATLLWQKGFESYADIAAYLKPSISQLHDPFLMKGMRQAVDRIHSAISNRENIMIYGDYDVDGTTAVTLVYSFLSKITQNVVYYIPDRYTEGYGISNRGIEVAAARGVSLIIALDCGIRSVDKVAYAKALGIDFIICDHHLPGDRLPEAIAVLDPKQSDCPYPFKELSGCGIGYKLCQAYSEKAGIASDVLYAYLDLVAVSISADLVPITGENRVLTHAGLHKLSTHPLPGFKSILEFNKIRKQGLSVSDVVFLIAPRINAAGRMDHGINAVQLMLAEDLEALQSFQQTLHQNNVDRKKTDETTTAEALALVGNDAFYSTSFSTVVYAPHWHKGVVGIVASRLIETHYKPTIVLTDSGDEEAVGSARSIRNFDIHEAIGECSELLTQFGGHTFAAGLRLPKANVDLFRQKFDEVAKKYLRADDLIPVLEIDMPIQAHELTEGFVKEVLPLMEPFGPQNMNPVFLMPYANKVERIQILKETHLSFEIETGIGKTRAVCFGGAAFAALLNQHEAIHLIFSIEKNEFADTSFWQLNVKHITTAHEAQ